MCNGDFAPLFLTLWIYPCHLILKTQFAPTLSSPFNGVNLIAKRPSCPCDFAPTCFHNLCFYPYFITHNTTGLWKQYTHVWKGFSHKIKTEMSCIYLETFDKILAAFWHNFHRFKCGSIYNKGSHITTSTKASPNHIVTH